MKKRVLIVDDSATVRSHILQALSTEYECLQASDGVGGLETARSSVPDAMIVDLEMPVMNGIEMLRQLKDDVRTKAIPVVIVTTVTAADQMNTCRALGCAGFVLKPVDVAYLTVKLRQLLARPAPKKK